MEQRCTMGLQVGDINLYNLVCAHTEKVISPSFLTQQTSCHLPPSTDCKRGEDEITEVEPETTGLVSQHMFLSIKHIPSGKVRQQLCPLMAGSKWTHKL